MHVILGNIINTLVDLIIAREIPKFYGVILKNIDWFLAVLNPNFVFFGNISSEFHSTVHWLAFYWLASALQGTLVYV